MHTWAVCCVKSLKNRLPVPRCCTVCVCLFVCVHACACLSIRFGLNDNVASLLRWCMHECVLLVVSLSFLSTAIYTTLRSTDTPRITPPPSLRELYPQVCRVASVLYIVHPCVMARCYVGVRAGIDRDPFQSFRKCNIYIIPGIADEPIGSSQLNWLDAWLATQGWLIDDWRLCTQSV